MKKSRILIPIVLAILSMHPVPTTAAQLDTWTWRNPLPTGNQLNGVTHGLINSKNLWVAVGANNTILTSPDGTNWDQQMSPSIPNCSLSSIVYSSYQSKPLFVAVGADAATPPNNVILTSPDGINWTAVAGLGSGGLLAVASDGNGNFMAVGKGGVNLHYSSASMTWAANSPIPGGQDFDGVAYGDNLYVAVGEAGSIYTTINGGSSWTSRDSSPQLTSYNLAGITYNGGAGGFVAVGLYYLLNSPDGTTWYATEGDSASAVVYGDGEFVTVNNFTYYVYTSPGSSTAVGGTNIWAANNVYYSFNAIDWDGSAYVAVGLNGTVGTSIDGINWTNFNSSVTGGELNAIAYGTTAALPGDNLFVAGGAGTSQQPVVIWSLDGYHWGLDTDPSIYNNFQFYNWFITGLTYGAVSVSPPGGGGGGTSGSGGSPGGGGTGGGSSGGSQPAFVATVNTYQGISGNASVIFSSTNFSLLGPIWAPVYTSKLNVLNGIACGTNILGQSLFVAVGNGGTVVSSTNPSAPSSWMSPIDPPTSSSLNAVAYGAGSFAAVGMYGTISYSSDGGARSWNASILLPTDSSVTFNSVAYGNGMFVAVGYYESIEFAPVGVVYTSVDGGASWMQQASIFTPPATSQPPFNNITFANGLFVAVSNDSGNGGDIFVSPDGVKWTQSTIAAPSLNTLVYGNYQYIAVGDGGEILGSQLPAASGASFNTVSGCFSFVVSGPPGTYGVYYSNDLSMPLPWNFVQNTSFTSTSYSTTVVDCNAGNSPNGFYYLGPKGP